jgi:hypothetical protein
MRMKTNVKAGAIAINHNEAQVRDLRVRTDVKGVSTPSKPGSGGQPGLRVQTDVKAGYSFTMKVSKASPML